MKLKDDAVFDVAVLTSMGVRINAFERQMIACSNTFCMQATSAESNVLNISSSLGANNLALTKFVKESSIASFIKSELRKRNINYISCDVEQGGPWGYRHQFNIADSGFGYRAPRVLNDRAGEVGRIICANDFDLEKIFKIDGVKIFHISGLIAALSSDTTKACVEIAKYAKKCGTKISFDINYRASFWKNRENELRNSFFEIASIADILIGNEEDFQLALGIDGPKINDINEVEKIVEYKKMISLIKKEFPNAEIFATTLRNVITANLHKWGAIIYFGNDCLIEEPRDIEVLDRIGGGDGFVGGLLYSLLKNYDLNKTMKISWASGAMVAGLLTDYASPESEEQLFSIYNGNARVKR